MIADKINLLREASHLTQTELAKKLNITRNSVNAWEMGISVPATTYLIELALLFHVSTDFLLGLEQNNTIDISTLSEREAVLVYELVDYFTSQKKMLSTDNIFLGWQYYFLTVHTEVIPQDILSF